MDAHRFLVWKVADGLSSKGITNVHPLFSYIDISSSSSSSTRLWILHTAAQGNFTHHALRDRIYIYAYVWTEGYERIKQEIRRVNGLLMAAVAERWETSVNNASDKSYGHDEIRTAAAALSLLFSRPVTIVLHAPTFPLISFLPSTPVIHWKEASYKTYAGSTQYDIRTSSSPFCQLLGLFSPNAYLNWFGFINPQICWSLSSSGWVRINTATILRLNAVV